MKKKTRNILIVISVILVFCFSVVGFAVYKAYSFFSQIGVAREIPDELKEARILKGAEILNKKEMFRFEKEELLKIIGKGAQTKDEKERQKVIQSQTARGIHNFADIKVVNNELIAVGQFGGFIFDLNGNLKREILFEPSAEKIKIGWYEQDNYQSNTDNLKIVELEKNKLGFSSFGSTQGFRVFDENGNQIWEYGKDKIDLSILMENEKERDKRFDERKYILEATVGDLDNDGISEYIVAVKNDGIRAFDKGGNEKWFQPDEFPSSKLKIADFDGDGKNELLEISSNSKIRDANGKVVREIKAGNSNEAVLFSEDKSNKKHINFCDAYKGKFTCVDENNKEFINFDTPLSDINIKTKKPDFPAPTPIGMANGVRAEPKGTPFESNSESIYDPQAVWVNFRKDKPKYLAVVASFISLPRSNFYLYDEKGTLVYHELLPEDAETIAVVPSANETQEIVIGGKNTIWRYVMN